MSNYIVSARKYRPSSFDSVVGQSALTTTLKNSIASGRLAHAYLFCGPRGVGKTTCARIFAKTINCLNPQPDGEACGECESCRAFADQRSYNIYELDAASNNGVEDIRQLIEQVNIPPQVGRYKVFIIDEVHMLSTAAFNAFLKTLEEPPAHAVFILATTEKHKLLPTILSRCQIYDFSRMTVQDTIAHLERVAQQEGITYEREALAVIAQKADGGMRDALSIFDQVASFCQGNITYQKTIADLNVLDYDYYFKLVDYFLSQSITDIMLTFDKILSTGCEGSHLIGGLNNHLRNLLVSRDEATTQLLEVSDDLRQRYAEQAKRCRPQFLYSAIRRCTDCDINYRLSQNKRLLVEITLIEIAQSAADDSGPASGRRPTRHLKPIFTAAAQSQTAAAATPAMSTGTPRMAQTITNNAPDPVQNQQTSPAPTSEGTGMKLTRSVTRFRISGSAAGTNATATAATPQAQAMQEVQPVECMTLSPENIVAAWRQYARLLPKDDASLAARMETMQPQLQPDGKTINVVVDNDIVQNQLRTHTNRIVQFLRKTFNVSEFTLNTRIRELAEGPAYHSPMEQLRMMCNENEALSTLCKEFDLVLN